MHASRHSVHSFLQGSPRGLDSALSSTRSASTRNCQGTEKHNQFARTGPCFDTFRRTIQRMTALSSYCANADDENAKSVMALPIKLNFFMTCPHCPYLSWWNATESCHSKK